MSGDLLQSLATVPDLRIGDEGPVWRDSLGRDHALTCAKRLSIAEVAVRLKCSVRTVRRRADDGELGPVARFSVGDIQLFACGIDDYITRALAPAEVAHV